jgi:hypothetical protein
MKALSILAILALAGCLTGCEQKLKCGRIIKDGNSHYSLTTVKFPDSTVTVLAGDLGNVGDSICVVPD